MLIANDKNFECKTVVDVLYIEKLENSSSTCWGICPHASLSVLYRIRTVQSLLATDCITHFIIY
jgi:hypothetical protein